MNNIFLLDVDKTTIAVLSNTLPKALLFMDDERVVDLENFQDNVKLTVPSNNEKAQLIKEDMYILYPISDDKYKLYVIKHITEESSETHHITLECEIAALTDMLEDYVKPTNFTNAMVKDVLAYILLDTNLTVGDVDDFGLIDFKIDNYDTKRKVLVDLCKQIEAEFDFSYVIAGSIVMEEKVNLVKKLGKDLGKVFIKERDLQSIKIEKDTSRLITAMTGVGKRDGEGSVLTFEKIKLELPYGYQQIGDTIYSNIALEQYGKNGRHIKGINNDDKAENAIELGKNTLELLEYYSKPITTYSAKVLFFKKISGENPDIGDVMYLQDRTTTTPIFLQARVKKLKTSLCSPDKNEIEFGDYLPLKLRSEDGIKQLQDTIKNYESIWNIGQWTIKVLSSAGDSFIDGKGETVLKAIVLKNNIEVDVLGIDFTYTWYVYDKDGNTSTFPDGAKTKTGKQITVNANDYNLKATYEVVVDITV